jgi:hypothetical protein
VEWDKHNDLYTQWPKDGSYEIMYNDAYFKSHTWIWDGKPHWAYNTPHMQLIAERSAIEWTPNTIASRVTISGDKATIALQSSTPNLKTYQAKAPGEAGWKDVPAVVEMPLHSDKNDFVFRTMNLAGVTGPEYRVLLEK